MNKSTIRTVTLSVSNTVFSLPFIITTSVILLLVFFIFSSDSTVVKPEMNSNFKSVLASNENAFKAANSHSILEREFEKEIPKSLEGIDLHITLPLDENGNLIVGLPLIDLFELYLSAMGEEELDDILLRIQHALAQQLTAPALNQGYDALKRFIDYKVELANLEKQPPNNSLSHIENIKQQKEIIASIQKEYFSPDENEALFLAETEYDTFMLEHLTIQENKELSPEEKHKQLEILEASLPENVKAGRERAVAPARIYQKAQDMKSEGYSEFQIYEMRSEALGEDSAIALAQLDRDREEWQQRLDIFTSTYQSISTSGLSEEDQKTEVNAVLERSFNETESIRVRALTGL